MRRELSRNCFPAHVCSLKCEVDKSRDETCFRVRKVMLFQGEKILTVPFSLLFSLRQLRISTKFKCKWDHFNFVLLLRFLFCFSICTRRKNEPTLDKSWSRGTIHFLLFLASHVHVLPSSPWNIFCRFSKFFQEYFHPILQNICWQENP